MFGAIETDAPHVSAIMVPDGRIIARAHWAEAPPSPLSSVLVVGDDLRFWYPDEGYTDDLPEFALRHAQLFGAGTARRLRRLTIGVVGCSGTGSIVIELLARLGVARLVLVEPEGVEERNLNRILNSTREDAYLGRPKVEVMARAIARMGFDTQVTIVPENLASRRAVLAMGECDVVFGCMDGQEGRYLLNRLASFYVQPYFDVGVRLAAAKARDGGVDEVSGGVHFLKPGGSSLVSRGVITKEGIKAEGLRRTNPAMYKDEVRRGYIRGVRENRPAVISINMLFASLAVNEFLARLHPYREFPNAEAALVQGNLIEGEFYRDRDGDPCPELSRHVGRGDVEPLLDRPELSNVEGT